MIQTYITLSVLLTTACITALVPYQGPIAAIDKMYAGVRLDRYGGSLELLVGPSKICDGLGLYIRNKDTSPVLLARGSPVCGYSSGGIWADEATGVFAVHYYFTSIHNGVIMESDNGDLMPLFEAVTNVLDSHPGSPSALLDLVDGHKLELLTGVGKPSSIGDSIAITSTSSKRFFIPAPPPIFSVPTPAHPAPALVWMRDHSNLGMFANDFGFHDSVRGKEAYNERSEGQGQSAAPGSYYCGCGNILQIAWRMEDREGRLMPLYPCLVTSRDFLFHNQEPMEIGLKYGWQYWNSSDDDGNEGVEPLPLYKPPSSGFSA